MSEIRALISILQKGHVFLVVKDEIFQINRVTIIIYNWIWVVGNNQLERRNIPLPLGFFIFCFFWPNSVHFHKFGSVINFEFERPLFRRMGQHQSKDELLYQQAVEGNVENINALCRQGAGLEWMDKDGKTALIVASMDPRLYIVAKTLIEMGSNVNAYRPGRHAGTPLHHAAKRGLDQTVRLLLSHGANAYVRNDDCQTPLDVARAKGFHNVVRVIEGHICYYSGYVRELLAPGFIGKLAPHLLSRKCWAVVVPCNPPNPAGPVKLELAVYPSEQDPQPQVVIPLWKSKLEEPKFHQADPVLIIFDQSSKTRYKFASEILGEKQQIRRFYNACTGISQMSSPIPSSDPAAEATLISTSIEAQPNSSVNDNGWGVATQGINHNDWSTSTNPPPSKASSSGWMPEPTTDKYNGWGALPEPSTASSQSAPTTNNETVRSSSSAPSAPPLPYDDGPINYPSIDMSPVEVSFPTTQNEAPKPSESKENDETMCVICWEAPIEGACIPCGHMAGCMSCLNEIKAKKGDCPVCRAKINQVVKIYAV